MRRCADFIWEGEEKQVLAASAEKQSLRVPRCETSNRRHLYGFTINYKWITADISCFLIRLCGWLDFRRNLHDSKCDESEVKNTKKKKEWWSSEWVQEWMCHVIRLSGDDKHLFFPQCHTALKIQGFRPTHLPSRHPPLIHFQQILRRLTCSRTSWGFMTGPERELICWTPSGVCISKLKSFRYQSNCFQMGGGGVKQSGRYGHVASLYVCSLLRRALTGWH